MFPDSKPYGMIDVVMLFIMPNFAWLTDGE